MWTYSTKAPRVVWVAGYRTVACLKNSSLVPPRLLSHAVHRHQLKCRMHPNDKAYIIADQVSLLGCFLVFRCPQCLHTQLIPLSQYPQCILSLDLCHLLPVRNATQRAIAIDDHGAEVVEFDRVAAAHIELHRLAVGRWLG